MGGRGVNSWTFASKAIYLITLSYHLANKIWVLLLDFNWLGLNSIIISAIVFNIP